MSYTPRLKRPLAGNKYYMTKASGGYSSAIKGYPLDSQCDVLHNCVGYAFGRFNEIGNYGFMKYLKPVNAELFIKYAGGLEVGQTPKFGACMVWEGVGSLAGHVAIVEQINKDGSIITSESGYGAKKAFWTTKRVKGTNNNWGENWSKYRFLGFIYNPAVPDEPIKPSSVDDVKVLSDGKEVTVWSTNIEGSNYIRLRDLEDKLDIAKISYDSDKQLPIIDSKNAKLQRVQYSINGNSFYSFVNPDEVFVGDFKFKNFLNLDCINDVKGVITDKVLVHARMLEALLSAENIKADIIHWYRDPEFIYKRETNNPNSRHITGTATDIAVVNISDKDFNRICMTWNALCTSNNTVGEIGRYDWGLHIGSDSIFDTKFNTWDYRTK